jgi:hypothetical protein
VPTEITIPKTTMKCAFRHTECIGSITDGRALLQRHISYGFRLRALGYDIRFLMALGYGFRLRALGYDIRLRAFGYEH